MTRRTAYKQVTFKEFAKNRKTRIFSYLSGITVIVFVFVIIAFCVRPVELYPISTKNPQMQATPTPIPTPIATTISITAVGDVLPHMPLINSVKQSDGTYDFDPIFAKINARLESADFTIANLETVTAGVDMDGYSGYPTFNSPVELITSLKKQGVDMLATANNHSLDRGTVGVFRTLDAVEQAGMLSLGSHATAAQADEIPIIDIKGVKVAFIGYTYGANGYEQGLSADKKWVLNWLDMDTVFKHAKKARKDGADVVVAYVHWGTEYEREPNDTQKEQAEQMLKAGVDVIFGTHPHVVQPIKLKTVKRDDGTTVTGLVVYSMGNFVSNQKDKYTETGFLVNVQIQKKFDKKVIRILKVECVPTYRLVYPNQTFPQYYQVLPVGLYANRNELLSKLPPKDQTRIVEAWQEVQNMLKKNDGIIIAEQ